MQHQFRNVSRLWLRSGTVPKILNSFIRLMIVAAFVVSSSVTSAKEDAIVAGFEKLKQYAEFQAAQGIGLPMMFLNLATPLSTNLVNREKGSYDPSQYPGHEEFVLKILDVMSRSESRLPVVIGDSGSGKTRFIEEAIQRINLDQLPEDLHQKKLGETLMFQMPARLFMPGAPFDLNAFINGVQVMSQNTKVKIGILFTEVQFMSPYNFSVLKEFVERPDHLPILLEATNKQYVTTIANNDSVKRHIETLVVPSFKDADLKKLVFEDRAPRIKQSTGLTITEDLVEAAMLAASDYRPDVAEPARTLSLLEDFAIYWSRARSTEDRNQNVSPERKDIFRFVSNRLDLPVLPQDEEAFFKYIENFRAELKEDVISQDALVDGLVDQFISALTSRSKKHQSAVISGPTGVGKSLVAERIGIRFFGSEDRILKIDMTEFKGDAKSARNALFGATNGFVSSEENKGVINEYLDGPGRRGGVIILNELEEADSSVQTLLMEMLDTGTVRGGDGAIRRLNRHLIVATSNKSSDKLLSPDRLRGISAKELDRLVAGITEEQLKKSWTEKSSFTEGEGQTVKSAVPERIDRFYFARPVLKEDALRITQLEIKKWIKDYQASGNTPKVEVDESFGAELISAFFNESLGARQVRKMVQKYLSNGVSAFKKEFGFKAEKLLISAKVDPVSKTKSYIHITDALDASRTLTLDGPFVPVENPLLDAETRKILTDLVQNLESEIFNQAEAIKAVVNMVKARYMNPRSTRTAAGILIGSTGTGKTEIAKVLAKVLFKDPTALGIFEMGKVKNDHDLYVIFSPPTGIIGSNTPGQFEQFLMKFPDGGVGLFDEFSNAGGNDPGRKSSILKEFYSMLDEGFYYSPVTQKRYDLRKYIFLFTGNDSEQYFKHGQSDEALTSVWEDLTKDPEGPRDILRESGVPDAFIGRNWFVNVMRPAISESKVKITKKLLDKWIAEVTEVQPIDITYDDKFVAELAPLVFSPKRGARSVNDFVSGALAEAAGDLLMKFDWDQITTKGERGQIVLSLKVKSPLVPFYTEDKPDKNLALLTAKAMQNGKFLAESSTDFTGSAFFMERVHVDSARLTGVHEMGHAVTSFTEMTGKKVKRISIVPERLPGGLSAAGLTAYESVPHKDKIGWDFLVMNIAGLLAGSEAEILFGGDRSVGRSNDVDRAGQMAYKILLQYHLVTELDNASAYLDKSGNVIPNLPAAERKILDGYVRKAINEGRALAIKTLKERWNIVLAGTELLIEQGTLNAMEFEILEKMAAESKGEASIAKKLMAKVGLGSLGGPAIDLKKFKELRSLEIAKSDALKLQGSASVGRCTSTLQ